MATTWDAFTPRLFAEMPRLSSFMAEDAVRDAVIEFCRKTRVLKQDHADIDSVANQASYSWAPGANLKVVRAEEIWYDARKLTAATAEDVSQIYGEKDWRDERGTPLYYLQEALESFILVPCPDSGITGAIKAKVSVRPSETAVSIDDALYDKYFEEILHGAKSRLFALSAQNWFNPDKAKYHRAEFDAAISRVSVMVDKGHTKMPLRSRTVHGVE